MKTISTQDKNVLRNILGAFAVKGGSLVISVVLLPLYLRFFQNQEILGIWYTILSVLNWVILFDLGLGQGLRNQLPKALLKNDKKLAKEYISTTYVLMTAVAAVVSVVGVILIKRVDLYSVFNVDESVIEYYYLQSATIIVFLGIMLQIILKIATSILYAMQKSAVVNALALLTNVIILGALCFIPSRDIGTNLVAMAWVNVIAANVPYIICTFFIFGTKTLKGTAPSLKAFTLHTQDYVAAADYVITKAGWGTVAECLLAQKPMALFARDSVLEDRTTIRLLEQKKLGIKVTYEQLTEMSDLLEQMKQITYPAVPEYHNAAAEIVSKLLTLTE